MSDRSGPVHRALRFMLLMLAEEVATAAWSRPESADATCEAVERALDALDGHALLDHSRDGAVEAIRALRAELRAQVAAVRAAEPGAVKRIQGLLHLLIEAELRHMLRQER